MHRDDVRKDDVRSVRETEPLRQATAASTPEPGGAAFACVEATPAVISAATATYPVVILRIVPSLKSGTLLAEPSVHAERTTWMTCASSRCYTHPARGKAI